MIPLARAGLLCCNTIILIWGFHPIKAEGKTSRQSVVLAYVTLILLRLPVYFFMDLIPYAWLQSIVRFLPCVVFLRLDKGLDWMRCFYFSCLMWVSFTLCSVVLRTPLLVEMIPAHISATSSDVVNQIIENLLWHGMSFLLVTLVTRCIPLNKINAIGSERICMLAFVVFCELYIIQTLDTMEATNWAEGTPALTVYLILLQTFVAMGIVLFERYLASNTERETARMAELESRYRYEGLLARQSAENDIRRVHHDMKNHLLAIHRLRGDQEAQEQYIHKLLHQELAAMEGLIRTGSDLLDGLLDEKLAQAKRDGLQLKVRMDFCPSSFLEDIDLCAIFGNILDNAMEAARQCSSPEEREIFLHSSQAADHVLITCSNHYSGKLRLSSDLPATTKADHLHHGIGLSSVRHCVEKYGGILTLDTSQPHQLIVTMLFPPVCRNVTEP